MHGQKQRGTNERAHATRSRLARGCSESDGMCKSNRADARSASDWPFSLLSFSLSRHQEQGCASTCEGYLCAPGWDPVSGLGQCTSDFACCERLASGGPVPAPPSHGHLIRLLFVSPLPRYAELRHHAGVRQVDCDSAHDGQAAFVHTPRCCASHLGALRATSC